MKLLHFSTRFLKGHPFQGRKTHFPEKILKALGINYEEKEYFELLKELNKESLNSGKLTEEKICQFWLELIPVETEKIHTLRKSTILNEGDVFSPVIWSGKPYKEPVLRFAPPQKVHSIESIYIDNVDSSIEQVINLNNFFLAKNDGLTLQEFLFWFEKDMHSYFNIIHFVQQTNYSGKNNMPKLYNY